MKKLFTKKFKQTPYMGPVTTRIECSYTHLDNFRDIRTIMDPVSADRLCHMIIKVDFGNSISVDGLNVVKAFMLLYQALTITPRCTYYVEDYNTLTIMNDIRGFRLLSDTLENICYEDKYSSDCVFCYQLKEYLNRVLDPEGKYDECYPETNTISLVEMNKSTRNRFELIHSFIYQDKVLGIFKSCHLVAVDPDIIDCLKNMIYAKIQRDIIPFLGIVEAGDNMYAVIKDISKTADIINNIMKVIDNEDMELYTQKLSIIQQKVFGYMLGYFNGAIATESDDVDFSDIDEVIEEEE